MVPCNLLQKNILSPISPPRVFDYMLDKRIVASTQVGECNSESSLTKHKSQVFNDARQMMAKKRKMVS